MHHQTTYEKQAGGHKLSLILQMRRAALYRLNSYVLDRLLGPTEPDKVASTTYLDEFTIDSNHARSGVEYTPSPRIVIGAIPSLLSDALSDWAFVDVSAGRGRVIATAAAHPYRKVVGIEFGLELHRDGSAYINALSVDRVRARSVEMRHADATCFDVPDGPCVFYLFNPFDAQVMRAFLDHIIADWRRNPRTMRLIYFNPVEKAVFEGEDLIARCSIEVAQRIKFFLFSPHAVHMYRIGPA